MRQLPSSRHDVVVVGARCAGAATAMLLAQAGHDVVLVDRAGLPSDTNSTHSLVRGGVVQLARWGLLDELLDTGAPPIRSVTFNRYDSGALPPVTLPVKDLCGVDHMLAPRRRILDGILAGAAVREGAALFDHTTFRDVLRDATGRVVGVVVTGDDGSRREIHADLVVGADGVRSRLAGLVRAPVTQLHEPTGACFYTYVDEVAWDGFEFHLGDNAFAGVFPTHAGAACVWLMRPTARARGLLGAGDRRLAAWQEALDLLVPDLGKKVRAGRVLEALRGSVSLPNHVRRPWGPGWALVGDAGYHRDPITGHGMTDAFRDAELLAEAAHIALSDPSEPTRWAAYEQARDAQLAETFRITRALGAFPHADRFTELQAELSGALDAEARELFARQSPVPALA